MLKYCSPLVLVLALITAVVASDNAPTTPSGSEAPEKEKVEKEGELIDFKAIKEVLKNDGLQNSADKKSDEVKQAGAIRQYKDQNRFSIPDAANFWPFFSEYWLIKNAPILKWDFQKPDYGIEESLEKLLEQTGFFEKKFKILLMDGPNVCHFALPSGEKEIIFLLSVPFIRAMDLSKTEIALLLFEDFIRLQKNYFVETVATPALKEMLGGNFFEKTLDKKIFSELLKKYDELIFAKGFNFQQQFAVTTEVGGLLKVNLTLWNNYLGLLKKIDNLVKTNLLFSNYTKIYPSPELQIGWLVPAKTKNIE